MERTSPRAAGAGQARRVDSFNKKSKSPKAKSRTASRRKMVPPPPPLRSKGGSMADLLADAKSQFRAQAAGLVRKKSRRKSAVPPPPRRPFSPAVAQPTSRRGVEKSSESVETIDSVSALDRQLLFAREGPPSRGPSARSRRPFEPGRPTTAPVEQTQLVHPFLDLGSMTETSVPPQLLFEPFSTTPAKVLNFQEWAPFFNDEALHMIVTYNHVVEELTLPSTMRVSSMALQRSLSQLRHLQKLEIVNTAKTEVEESGGSSYHCSEFWNLSKFDPSGPQISIRELVLEGNSEWVDDSALVTIAALFPQLRSLDVSNCHKITNNGLTELVKGCLRLEELSVNNCFDVSDYPILVLCQVGRSRLQKVCVSGTQVSDSSIERLVSEAKSLHTLELRGCRFDPEILKHLIEQEVIYGSRPSGGLPNLQRLDLAFCPQVHGLAMSWVAAGCSKLSWVSVRGCPELHNKGLSGIQGCQSLVFLDLARNSHLTDSGIRSLGGSPSASTLATLDVGGCDQLSDAALSSIAGSFPRVTDASFQNLPKLQGQGLLDFCITPASKRHLSGMELPDGRVASAAIFLRRLCLAGCLSLQQEPLIDAISACEQLRDVDISGIPCVDDIVLKRIEFSLRAVRRLSITRCGQVSDHGLSSLPFSNVQILLIAHLPKVTCNAVVAAIEPMRSLQFLDVAGCTSLVASRFVGELAKIGQHLAQNMVLEGIGGVHTSMEDLQRARLEFYTHHSGKPDSHAWISASTDPNVMDTQEIERPSRGQEDPIHPSPWVEQDVAQQHDGVLGLRYLNVLSCCKFAFAGEREALWQSLEDFVDVLQPALVHRLRVEKDSQDFVGLITTAADTTAVRRHEYAHAFAIAQGSALTIQCFYRTVVARRAYYERYVARANYLHSHATTVQTAVRGLLARNVVARLRHEAKLQAARDHEAMRTLASKFRERYVKRQRRFLLTRVFGFLRLWTRARRRAKNVAKVTITLWRKWRILHDLYRKRTLAVALPALQRGCIRNRTRRQHITKVFLNCVPSTALNSSAQRNALCTSTRFARRRYCVPIMEAWQRDILDILRQKKASADAHHEKSCKKIAICAWKTWLVGHNERKAFRQEQFERACSHHRTVSLRKHLRGLLAVTKLEQKHRAAFERLRGQFSNRLLRRSFNTLVFFVLYRRKLHMADAHARLAHMRTTMRFWRFAVLSSRRRDMLYRRSIRLALHRSKKRCFVAMWKWVSRGRLLPLVMFKVKRRHALMHRFALWRFFVEFDRAEEAQNKAEYLRQRAERKRILLETRAVEFKASSLMQAVWRAHADRKFALFRRTFLEKYVVRIQALFRRAQAKVLRRKRERMNRLQDFKAREYDQMQMELADHEGHQLRSFERAVTRLQASVRGRFHKMYAYKLKQRLVRQRAIDERNRRRLALQQAEKKKEQRQDDSELRELMAVRIQCLYRQRKAVTVYQQVVRHYKLVDQGTRIQTWYRFRQANKERQRLIRLRDMKAEMNKRRFATAAFLRALGMKTRRRQNEVRRALIKGGVYPDTFCGDAKSLAESLHDDFHEFMRHMRSSLRFFFHSRHKATWAREHEVPVDADELVLQKELWLPGVSRFDSIQVLNMDHPRFGETGFVLGFLGDGGYGTKAAVKMDFDCLQVYIPLWQAIKGVGMRPSLSRIPTPEYRAFTQNDIEPCRAQLLIYAQKAAVKLREYRAARRVQKVIRMRRARRAISETRRLFYRAIQLRRQQVYRVLSRLHLATSANGRLLVNLRILKPEEMPNLPESIDFDFQGYRKKVDRALRGEIKDLFQEKRAMLYRQVKAGKIDKSDVLRWRERTPAALAMSKFSSWIQKHVLFKVAEKLIVDADTLDLDNDEDERSKFLHGLSQSIGGAEFFYDEEERSAWAGLHYLAELRQSPHVTHNPIFPVSGHCIVHGVWNEDVPHGDGTAWFPVGRDPREMIFARQKKVYQDADREWPLYDEIQGSFDRGKLRTDVITQIRFRTGDRYIGYFVPFGGKARKNHKGTWHKANGWIYKGKSVTNHFNFKNIEGFFRVVTPKGGRYTGYIFNNKRHGFGYMKFGLAEDSPQYRGEWRIGLRHGFGTYVSKEGDVYTGEWKNDKKHGRGVEKMGDGITIYEGNFVDGRWHGTGVLIRPSKHYPGQLDRIEGQFEYGYIHGEATQLFPNGDKFEGRFEKSKRIGKGKVFFTTNERYEGNFEDDEMHGRGVWVKPRGSGYDEKRVGIWEHGNHQRWLGYAVSKLVTQEFCDRFREGDTAYKGMYAQFVAEKIPDLPTGVDGSDDRVGEILSKIMLEQGPLAQKLMLQRTQEEFTLHQPIVEAANEKLAEAKTQLETCTTTLDTASRRVRQCKRSLKQLREVRDTLEKELDTFWENDEHRLQERFTRTQKLLKELSREDWYKLRALPAPPPPIEMTLQSCLAIFGITDLSWDQVKLLCNDNIVNMRFDDKDAFVHTYDNKFCFETERLDVYAVAKRPPASDTMKSIERVFYHPDVRPNNPEVYEESMAASRAIAWFRRFFLYMRKAREVLPTYDKLIAVKRDIDNQVESSYEAEDKLKAAEASLRSSQTLLEITEAVHKTVIEKRDYLQATLDRIHQTVIDLTGNTLVRELASTTLEDALEVSVAWHEVFNSICL